MSPRFQGANLDTNLALVERCARSPTTSARRRRRSRSPGSRRRASDIVPLVGARRRDRLTEALGALDVKLTPAHLRRSPKRFRAGRRSPASALSRPTQLAHLDSEKRSDGMTADTSSCAPSPLRSGWRQGLRVSAQIRDRRRIAVERVRGSRA